VGEQSRARFVALVVLDATQTLLITAERLFWGNKIRDARNAEKVKRVIALQFQSKAIFGLLT
jgi:hypothetical protein